jgi:putative cell wall-binding protein
VFIGAGDGTFTEDADSPFGDGTDDTSLDSFGGSLVAGAHPLAVGDLDDDGFDDIAVTAPTTGKGAVILSTYTSGGGGGGGGGGSSSRPHRPEVTRSGGADRYDTAAESNADLGSGVDVAYVTTGENFPDALATGPVAGIEGAALLLVSHDAIPADVATQLARLRPDRIVVVGGVAAVSEEVEDQLSRYTDGSVRRIAGVDRYETALQLATDAFPRGADVVYLVSGTGFAEAVAAGPAAGLQGGPILLVHGSTLPSDVAAQLQRLDAPTIVLAGGTGSVTRSMEEQVRLAVGDGVAVLRAGLYTRYSTAVALAERIVTDGTDTLFVSTGEVFADGLAATPWAIREESPIILVPPDGDLPRSVEQFLLAHPDTDVIVVGGTAAIAPEVFDQIEATRS